MVARPPRHHEPFWERADPPRGRASMCRTVSRNDSAFVSSQVSGAVQNGHCGGSKNRTGGGSRRRNRRSKADVGQGDQEEGWNVRCQQFSLKQGTWLRQHDPGKRTPMRSFSLALLSENTDHEIDGRIFFLRFLAQRDTWTSTLLLRGVGATTWLSGRRLGGTRDKKLRATFIVWRCSFSDCCGNLDSVSMGPGELLFLRKAAAACPALLCRPAAARPVHAGKRLRAIFINCRDHGTDRKREKRQTKQQQ